MYFMISLLFHFVTISPVVHRDGLAIGHEEAWGKDTLGRSDWNSRKLQQALLRPTRGFPVMDQFAKFAPVLHPLKQAEKQRQE